MDPSNVAETVISQFRKLPNKGKPLIRGNGVPEWTVLAGIVSSLEPDRCLCLATGVKVMQPENARGKVLHDMHAEILCIRAFNLFVLQECERSLAGNDSKYIERMSSKRFRLKNKIKFSMYISEMPCGDSSMHLLSDGEDPWSSPPALVSQDGPIRGRGNFNITGVVRTKPGRADSTVSLSKSCTDKLALRQFTSLILGCMTPLICSKNFNLESIVVPDRQLDLTACIRAFGKQGRLAGFENLDIPEKYAPVFFNYEGVNARFEFEKAANSRPCSSSIIYSRGLSEVILNGVKMGYKAYTGETKGMSMVSRYALYERICKIYFSSASYLEFKHLDESRAHTKQQIYKLLRNWTSNVIDDFILD